MKQKKPKNFHRSALLIAALLLVGALAAFFASRGQETSSVPANYTIGEVAKQDVFAPKKFTVIDPVETEARRKTELEKVPAIFRFQKTAPEEVVAHFTTEFVASREEFLDAVEKEFKKRTLGTNQVAGPRFRQVFVDFKTDHKMFPATIGQALKWAHGNEQESLQAEFRASLRKAAGRFIRSEELPEFARTGPLRVVNDNFAVSTADLVARSQPIKRTNLVALSKARRDLATSFAPTERIVSDVLTNFLKVNCIFDEALTAQLQAEKTNAVWVVATYQPGQAIVQRGQIIDAKIKAALDALGVRASPVQIKNKKQPWWWAVAISCVALALFIGLRIVFKRRVAALVPVENVLPLPMSEKEKLQAQLMPHLAQGLMTKLVRGLISQRADLIQTQNAGAKELDELEQRLEQINSRLHTRQAAYEQRIAELEKELAAAEEENRELIRAKIHEARQNLEWAKAQNR